MAISKVVKIGAQGGGVAPQQQVMKSSYRVPQFHPGPDPWGSASKTIDKALPALAKIFKNKRTIEALKRAMGPKPEGASKLTNMAYKIMEAGSSTNDPQLYSQGISMLGKQEGRQYYEGRDEFRYGRGRKDKLEDLLEGRKYGKEREETLYKRGRIDKFTDRDEQRLYSENLATKKLIEYRDYADRIRKETRNYGEDLYGQRTKEQREYSESQYLERRKDRRDYQEEKYKEHRNENRTYNERIYGDRLKERRKTNSEILKEKREYAWTIFEKKQGIKITASTKLRHIKRDEKKAIDDAKRDEGRAYKESQADLKFIRSHPHDFGPKIGRVTTSQAYSMWKEANELASEMELEILKTIDQPAYRREKDKIADSEGQFGNWIQSRVRKGKANAETTRDISGSIPDSGSIFSMEGMPSGGVTPIEDSSKFRNLSDKAFGELY